MEISMDRPRQARGHDSVGLPKRRAEKEKEDCCRGAPRRSAMESSVVCTYRECPPPSGRGASRSPMTTCLRAWSAAWLEALHPLPDPDLDGQATDGCLKRRIYQGLHDGALL